MLNDAMVYGCVMTGELEIDSDGRIWRLARRSNSIYAVPRRRTETVCKNGYLKVQAMFDGRQFSAYAHRLVWLHFNGAVPADRILNHKNGDKGDNRPGNLELVTYSGNLNHARHVLKTNRKLTDEDIRAIRARGKAGEDRGEIAGQFGINRATVNSILRGAVWSSVV